VNITRTNTGPTAPAMVNSNPPITSFSGSVATYSDNNIEADFNKLGLGHIKNKTTNEAYLIEPRTSEVFAVNSNGTRENVGSMSEGFSLDINGTKVTFKMATDAHGHVNAVGIASSDNNGVVFNYEDSSMQEYFFGS
jgi:hypothetical protein